MHKTLSNLALGSPLGLPLFLKTPVTVDTKSSERNGDFEGKGENSWDCSPLDKQRTIRKTNSHDKKPMLRTLRASMFRIVLKARFPPSAQEPPAVCLHSRAYAYDGLNTFAGLAF